MREVDGLEVFRSLGPEIEGEDEVPVGSRVVDRRDPRFKTKEISVSRVSTKCECQKTRELTQVSRDEDRAS